VRHVVVDPAMRRAGVGRALMDVIAHRLRERGCSRWCLNVKESNVAARTLYERVGMKNAYESVGFKFPWSAAARLPRASDAVDVERVKPEDDAAIEARFDLPNGMLAGFRATPGQLLFALRERGTRAIVGFSRFAPGFPGSFPFRVSRTDLASVLLDTLPSHSHPEHDWLMLTVEDDADLVRAIEATGARTTMRLLHMRGDVPR
jgi:hypothetical protein